MRAFPALILRQSDSIIQSDVTSDSSPFEIGISRMVVRGSRGRSDSARSMRRHVRARSRKRRSRKLRPPIMKIKGASKSAAALVPILQCGHGEIEVLHQTVVPAGQVARRAQSRKNFQHG